MPGPIADIAGEKPPQAWRSHPRLQKAVIDLADPHTPVPAGKLYTSNPAGLSKLTEPAEAELLLITRAGYPVPDTVQVQALSPSPSLFRASLEQRNALPPEEWWPAYEERFRIELKSNEKLNALRQVYRQLLAGKTVVLICFCKDHRYCHRRLVGEFFAPYGVEAEELNPVLMEQITLF